MTTTTTFPPSKARYACDTDYLKVMERVQSAAGIGATGILAIEFARKATQALEARESFLDDAMGDDLAPDYRHQWVRMADRCRMAADTWARAAIMTLGMNVDRVAPVDFPAIVAALVEVGAV